MTGEVKVSKTRRKQTGHGILHMCKGLLATSVIICEVPETERDAVSQQPQCCMGMTSINRQVGVLILGPPLTAAAVKREFGLNSQMDMTYASFSFGDICRLCKETSSWTLEPHPWTSVLCLFSAVCFASSSSSAPAPASSWCCVFPKIMAVPIETHNALFGPGSVCTAISR